MKPPIIISESGDISIFKSVIDAERYMESPDVIEGRYTAYDSEGFLLKLEAASGKDTRLFGMKVVEIGKVSIISEESEPPRIEELRQTLVCFLEKMDVNKDWLVKATLRELLARTIEKTGFTE